MIINKRKFFSEVDTDCLEPKAWNFLNEFAALFVDWFQ
jgi:hypothetical protein